jgi:hypothetical protein
MEGYLCDGSEVRNVHRQNLWTPLVRAWKEEWLRVVPFASSHSPNALSSSQGPLGQDKANHSMGSPFPLLASPGQPSARGQDERDEAG